MKYTAETKISDEIDCFVEKHKQSFIENTVDYFGINISDDFNSEIQYKIYYNDKASREELQGTHALVGLLENMDMIRYSTMVSDKSIPAKIRCDIGLKNRTNINMSTLFKWLDENTRTFREFSSEIKHLSQMKMTNRAGFDFASLYFLGFICMNNEIEILKFHFFNRLCMDPDVLHKNIQYTDDYYLSFLSNSGINTFASLSSILHEVLQFCGGHLWMTGVDYEDNHRVKCKIYIKNPSDMFEGLLKVFDSKLFNCLHEQIECVKSWQANNSNFYCEGFAVCENETGIISINYYFKHK